MRTVSRIAATSVGAALALATLVGPASTAALPTPSAHVAEASAGVGAERLVQPAPALRVDGDQIVGPDGEPIQLGGVNRAGAEYACAQGWGIFDGPVDRASIKAIASWHANAVRIPLNEHCWLGINGVSDGSTAARPTGRRSPGSCTGSSAKG